MSPKQERKPDDEGQSKWFVGAAREREADESEEGADRACKKIVLPPGEEEKLGTKPNECSVSMISACPASALMRQI